MKKVIAIILSVIICIQGISITDLYPVYASDKISNVIDAGKKEAGDLINKGKDTASSAAKKAKESVSQGVDIIASKIDKKKLKKGWDTAAKLFASSKAAQSAQKLVTEKNIMEIADQIEVLQKDMNSLKNSATGVGTDKGFAFEKWTADTFNIDAAAKGSKEKAWQVGSTKKGSVDVDTTYGEKASLKAYKDGASGAKAQAKANDAAEVLDGFYKYNQDQLDAGKSKISLQDYVDKHMSSEDAMKALEAEYKGQTRIIPKDQLQEATDYLNGKITDTDQLGSTMKAAERERYQETLENLKDRLEAPDGTSSKPVTAEELQSMTELAEDGKFKPEKFHVNIAHYVTWNAIFKEVSKAGAQAAVLQIVLTVGPELYTVVADGLKNGNLDKSELKKTGIDAAIAGGNGFAQGAVSDALLLAFRAGKFGKNLKNVSPDVVGTLAVITIDAISDGYKVSKGQMTKQEYADDMQEEIIVAALAQTSGVALQALLPLFPFAYLAGSMAGGMLASMGYTKGKEVVLEINSAGGLGVIVPKAASEGINVGKNVIAATNWDNKASSFKSMMVSTAKNGMITVKSKVTKGKA